MLRRRRWVNLNGEWEFGLGAAAVFDRRILVPFCPQSELSGIGERVPGDVVWYRRRFSAPAAERLLLHFGAVDYRATVWVNGRVVAGHEGGHVPFSADVTAAIQPGDNLLVVRAEDPLADRTIPRGKQYWRDRPESIFYTATTGIWQTVWLEPLPVRHIERVRLRPDPENRVIHVDVRAEGRVEVIASLLGREVGRWSGAAGHCPVDVDTVEPWSPESPALYDLEIRLLDGAGGVTDLVASYAGMRTIEARDGRLLLNGDPYVHRLVLDQGYFPGGLLTAPGDDALRRDIQLAKGFGFNGARKHQKVEDPRWLYWADRLGFLVWSEMANAHERSEGAEQRLAAEWEQAVLRDRDHPCVAAWVPVNESFGLGSADDPRTASFLVALYSRTHELDGSRPVVSNDGWEHALSDLCTLHDYSSAADLAERYRSLDSTLAPVGRPRPPYLPAFAHRGEPVLVTEFGGLALAGSGGWGWSEVAGQAGFLRTYQAMVEALMQPGPVEGFCYTQLTDVEQERNGLLTFDRRPKVDPSRIRPITESAKKRR